MPPHIVAFAAVFAAAAGLSGLEFAHGIPGTVGGGVYMNAGAYGGEMKEVIYSVEYFDSDGTFKLLYNNEDSDYFSYRHSYFSDNTDCIITGVTLKLKKSINQDPMEVAERNMRWYHSSASLYPL